MILISFPLVVHIYSIFLMQASLPVDLYQLVLSLLLELSHGQLLRIGSRVETLELVNLLILLIQV